jgi:hypothetical protein
LDVAVDVRVKKVDRDILSSSLLVEKLDFILLLCFPADKNLLVVEHSSTRVTKKHYSQERLEEESLRIVDVRRC